MRPPKRTKRQATNHEIKTIASLISPTRSRLVAQKGIKNTQDFMNLMEAVMQDLAEEKMNHQRANAMTNAGGKMLKAADMQMRYGTRNGNSELALPLGQKASEGEAAEKAAGRSAA